MKGFMKMLEVILAAIIMLSSLSYFFSFQARTSEWPGALLENSGKDVLASLDKSGNLRIFIETNNFTEEGFGLEYYIRKMVPRTVLYSLEFENIPKPDIMIGCNCTLSEIEEVRRQIMVFQGYQGNATYKGRRINFTVVGENLSNLLTDPGYDKVDAILMFSYHDFSEYSRELEEYLDRGKSIIAVTDIQQGSVSSYFNELFRIGYSPGIPADDKSFLNYQDSRNISRSLSGFFVSTTQRINTTQQVFGDDFERSGSIYIRGTPYQISTYFDGLNSWVNYTGTLYSEGDAFQMSGGGYTWNVSVKRIDSVYAGDQWTYADVSIIDRGYVFSIPANPGFNNVTADENTVLATANGFSSMQANTHASKNGNGRAIWMEYYDTTNTDINQLLAATIMWSTSGRYNLDEELGNAKPIPSSFEKVSYVVSGNGEFEPYSINLLLWYLF